MKPKKIPERRCVGCGISYPKRELIRVVRSPEGAVSLDFKGKAPGRGAYVCRNLACFRRARKAGRISANLDTQIPDEVYAALEAELIACGAPSVLPKRPPKEENSDADKNRGRNGKKNPPKDTSEKSGDKDGGNNAERVEQSGGESDDK